MIKKGLAKIYQESILFDMAKVNVDIRSGRTNRAHFSK